MFAAKTRTFWSLLFELCWICRCTAVATDAVAGYVPWLSWQLLQLVLRCIDNFNGKLLDIDSRLTVPNFIHNARFLWELFATMCVPHFLRHTVQMQIHLWPELGKIAFTGMGNMVSSACHNLDLWPFGVISTSQAQVHMWPNFGEISSYY